MIFGTNIEQKSNINQFHDYNANTKCCYFSNFLQNLTIWNFSIENWNAIWQITKLRILKIWMLFEFDTSQNSLNSFSPNEGKVQVGYKGNLIEFEETNGFKKVLLFNVQVHK